MLARTSSGLGNERFVARRRKRRRQLFFGSLFLLLLIMGAGLYEVRQDTFRISHIEMYGGDASLTEIASSTMQGYYLGLIPRDSTFFFPESRIRAALVKEHPTIAAVSFFRNGFKGLSIKISERVAIARWCGLGPTEGVDPYCYLFDAGGVIFAPAQPDLGLHEGTTSAQILNQFELYAPLEGESEEPLRATIAHAALLPHTFDFARQLASYGSPVTYIVIRGDEINLYLTSGTRVTYVLANEQNAFTALTSSKENFNLADGSVEYVDLRFDGKVYVKKKE